MAEDCPIWWKCCYTMKCIEDAADIGVVTAGGKIVVEFLDKTIYNERVSGAVWHRLFLKKGRTGF